MWKRLKPYVEAAATVRGSGSGPFVLETATPCDRGYQLLYRRCCSRIFWCPTSACRCCLVSSQTAPARRASPLRSCSGCCHRVHGCSPHTSGCSPEYMRSRPPTHTVAATPPPTAAACATYGYSLRHLRLQPAPPTVAACATDGCSLTTYGCRLLLAHPLEHAFRRAARLALRLLLREHTFGDATVAHRTGRRRREDAACTPRVPRVAPRVAPTVYPVLHPMLHPTLHPYVRSVAMLTRQRSR